MTLRLVPTGREADPRGSHLACEGDMPLGLCAVRAAPDSGGVVRDPEDGPVWRLERR